MTHINEDAAAMKQLFVEAAKLDKQAKEKRAEAKEAEFNLMARMEDEGFDLISHGGTKFVPTRTPYANVSDRSEFIKWALENNPSMVDYKERTGVMTELLREHLDDGKPPPPGVDFHVRTYISKQAA